MTVKTFYDDDDEQDDEDDDDDGDRRCATLRGPPGLLRHSKEGICISHWKPT